MKGLSFTGDTHIQTAARVIMAGQQAGLRTYEADLRTQTSVLAGHETRKAIRRLRTAFELFEPYLGRRALKPHRRGLKQYMRFLARSRDIDVFLLNLERFSAEALLSAGQTAALDELRDYWIAQDRQARAAVRAYLATPAYTANLTQFERFLYRPSEPGAGLRVRYVLPVLLYQRLADVYTAGDGLNSASLTRLHQLRIRFKDLRYTLEFFGDVLGAETTDRLLEPIKGMLTNLGDLNDAHVHRQMLKHSSGYAVATMLYDGQISAEMTRLIAASRAVWPTFDNADWQADLQQALAQCYARP